MTELSFCRISILPALDDSSVELTTQEQLLAALLEANETLLEALRVYNDLERVANENQVKERSTLDARANSVVSQRLECYVIGHLIH
jgi:hypothetical protein